MGAQQAASPSSPTFDDAPPPYEPPHCTAEALEKTAPPPHCLATDPRTSSTQSLVSTVSESDPRRKLLLVYIHGFYGNDQSFRSFPFHIHTFLKDSLSETHIIHSKIYPRYKTYRSIDIARDNFSEWLTPHESPTTDVILVGHSMGGILAADVVLMKPRQNPYHSWPFQHRILGTISLDSPFLGLHPGIVVSGISSLFTSAPEPPQEEQGAVSSTEAPESQSAAGESSTSTLERPGRQPSDPFFNPAFFNDNPFKEAPFLKRIKNFARKHREEGLVNATAKHVLSHLEYGGCLADFHGLNVRYNKIRELEDVDEVKAFNGGTSDNKRRVRFVNYYTLSSGRIKRPKSPQKGVSSTQLTPIASGEGESIAPSLTTSASNASALVEDHSDAGDRDDSMSKTESEMPADSKASIAETGSRQTGLDSMSLQGVEPLPIPEDKGLEPAQGLDLPPIPDLPTKPDTPDFDQYSDKDSRKQAEKEFKRQLKMYESNVKDRNKAIREREKLIEKRQKKAQKETEKAEKEAEKQAKKEAQEAEKANKETEKGNEKDAIAPEETGTPEPQKQNSFGSKLQSTEGDFPLEKQESFVSESETTKSASTETPTGKEKAKKQKKFCTLPRKNNGERDRAWVDIYMEGVDEIGAHCGLFFPGPHYERLIGDVSSRIIGWVHDDLSVRAIQGIDQEHQITMVEH